MGLLYYAVNPHTRKCWCLGKLPWPTIAETSCPPRGYPMYIHIWYDLPEKPGRHNLQCLISRTIHGLPDTNNFYLVPDIMEDPVVAYVMKGLTILAEGLPQGEPLLMLHDTFDPDVEDKFELIGSYYDCTHVKS